MKCPSKEAGEDLKEMERRRGAVYGKKKKK